MQWRKILEQDFVARLLWRTKIDFVDFQQCKIPFTFFWWPDLAKDGIAGSEAEASNLLGDT